MFKNLPAMWLVSIFSLSGIAAAQTPVQPSPVPDSAPASPFTYRSAFEGYQPYAEETIANWKSTNDTVEKIGGWREYARQSRQPANTPAQTNRAGEAAPKAKP